jgi:transcriptional regulator with GAF, ATPase, and Fis domain
LGRLEEALHDLEISKQLLSKVPLSSHSRYLMARATLELGEVYLKKKDFQKSRNYFTEALNRAEEDPNLKSFCFYPLASLAHLALAEQEFETFRELYPKLVYLAEGEEKKKILADLLSEAPEDPRQGMEQGHPSGGAGHGPAAARTVPRESHFLPTALSQEALLSILKTNRALITEHDPDHLFQKILQYATELSGAESALLLEVSEENELYARTAFNTQIDQAQKEISHQIAHRVLKSGNSIATQDALEDQGFNQYQSVVSLKLRSIACVPIRLHQKVIGLLYLTHRNKTQLFSPEIVHILEAFGDQVGMVLQNAQHLQQLTQLNRQLRERLTDAEAVIDQLKTDLRARVKNPYPKILGKSPPIVETLQTLDRISDTNLSVLILGETGSGKELVARSIHDNSRRKLGRFVAVNCGAIPENLLESELFGYAAGAFTGANRDKKGLLEEAEGGTLFLDEVSELPLKMQVKLLRALQEKEIHRLGTTQPIPVDFRVIAATHRDLEKWVAEEKFREDLFYRLTQMVLALPPLRNRLEDLVLLSEHFLQESAKELDLKKSSRLSKELLNLMMDYPWPGNVRELENFIRTASAFAERGVVHPGNLPVFLRNKLNSQTRDQTPTGEFSKTTGPEGFFHPDWPWKKYEEALFAKALLEHQMNCEKAAEALGVGVATVYVKMRRYGLKNNAAKWEGRETGFPPGLTVAQLKQKVIEAAYQHHRQSPYAVAKQLEVNVGTVYRNLKG